MKRRLPPLGSLRVFDTVARLKSFKLAAEEIGVSPTAISHQIKLLENQLMVRVFERSPRHVKLTTEGNILYSATTQAFSLLKTAIAKIDSQHTPVPLTLTATTAFISFWLVPHLTLLREQLPDIDLLFHANDNVVDIESAGVDLAIRYGFPSEEETNSHPIFKDDFVLAASPSLRINKLEDLLQTTLIHTDGRRIPDPSPDWNIWRSQFGPKELAVSHGLHFTDEVHSIQSAIAGQGVVIASRLMIRQAIKDGLLVCPFPYQLRGATYYIVENPSSQHTNAIKYFRQWIETQINK
ncbi:LysR family transcriptional regulator [Xenorhabdus mauleonii]|uniref:LysR family transcriptional regulator n=1 Tax=Xenorhabdus mauleonii TaxID=351675 RepID=A0A1I3IY38_9GAMM|nr:LysR substrate-binding domain-containing protein [Xenorhabdus mauleonii]PHM46034.1 LysR family transcriptional regulator [Xenorhabdus mauleonii]SFI52884.1 LysR family transcriptional regulator, glycine cleavage system transcriptional activator [Xenorhabdus mauleonii]